MGNDATEAALGLLGLTSAAFDTAPTVPLKRKQSPPSSSRHQQTLTPSTGSDTISCICGFTYDDGFSIGCDICSRWCHAACFGIVETEVPEEWQCWVCSPRPVDKERAIRVQKARQRTALSHEAEKQRRRMSPGVDRKGRKTSGSTTEGGGQAKRKRRASTAATLSHEDEHVDIDEPWALSYVHIHQDIVPHDETRDRLRRVASRWRGVTALKSDPSEPTRPAIVEPGDFQSSPLVNLRPIPSSSFLPSISANLDPSVRPPSYAAHTVRAIPSSGMITPYVSTITPSTTYLADPLNAYAHLSMPKPFVHLIGPPLDVALDSRSTGNLGRFVRNGCRPNAVLRPVLCPRDKMRATASDDPHDDEDHETLTFGVFALRDLKAHEEVILGWEWDDGSVVHQLPALIDSPHIFPPHEFQHLRQQLISMLHALSSTFTTCACGSKTRDCALARIAEFVDSHIPPTPSPSPPTPVPLDGELWGTTGERSRVRTASSEGGIKKRINLGPLVGVERGFRTRERVPLSGGMGGVEMVSASPTSHNSPSLHEDPHISSRTASESHRTVGSTKDRKGKAKATDVDYALWETSTSATTNVDENTAPIPQEANLPPKLRKRWIRKVSDSLRATHPSGSDESPTPITPIEVRPERHNSRTDEPMQVDESAIDPATAAMPPPPLPPRLAALSPHMPSTIALPNAAVFTGSNDMSSPSTRFANLSLLSPVTYGPSPYFTADAARRSPTPPPLPLAPSSPAQPSDDTWEQKASREEAGDTLPPAISRRTQPSIESTPMGIEGGKVQSPSQEPAPSEGRSLSTDENSSSPLVNAESKVHGTGLSSQATVEDHVAVGESGSMDVSADHSENTVDQRDVAMSSPTVPSLSMAEEHTVAADEEMTAPPEELMDLQAKRTPSPPPRPQSPPKVKLSLKDFALRKRKQREQDASKTQERRSSLAPSDAPSSQPTTPAAQSAPLVESPATYVVSLAPVEEYPAPDAGVAHSQQSEDAIITSVALQGDKLLAEPDQTPVPSAEERLVKAREAFVQDPYGLKLEMMEPSVPPDTRMSNGRHPELSTKPVEPVTLSSESKTEPEPPAKTRNLFRHATSRASSIGAVSDRSPREGSSKALKSGTRSPRPDAAQEDGEILSPAPKSLPLPPRSNSPPTRPRSFHPPRAPANFAPRRPFRHQTLQNTLPPDRHLPNAPRALRDSLYSSQSGRPPGGTSLPRGPSADRERVEWERERVWVPSSRGRGRGSNWNR